jgi:hypothetical protein
VIAIKFLEGLLRGYSIALKHCHDLGEDCVLPLELRVAMLQTFAHYLILIFQIISLFLHGSELLFSLEVLANLCLQACNAFSEPRVALNVISVPLLEEIVLTLNALVLSQWHGQSQLSEQEFDLLDGSRLPFLEFIDTCLHVHILISKICLTRVVIAS